jgi:hypothetical protein
MSLQFPYSSILSSLSTTGFFPYVQEENITSSLIVKGVFACVQRIQDQWGCLF